MNILFIGPHRQFDGWGQSAKLNLRALLTQQDVNVTARPLYLSSAIDTSSNPEFDIAENTIFDNYDAVIQQTLPTMAVRDKSFGKNVIFTLFETSVPAYWKPHLKLFDQILVHSNEEKRNVDAAKLGVRCTDVGMAVDSVQTPLSDLFPKYSEFFKFYFVGENIERKNIMGLLEAYYKTFSRHDKVLMVLKTGNLGMSPEDSEKRLIQQIGDLKRELRIYRRDDLYPEVNIITSYLTTEQMNSLHYSCDAFCMPSKGEAICLPALDALSYGNPVICTQGIGTWGFVKDTKKGRGAFAIPSIDSPCRSLNPPLTDLYSSNDTWKEPNIEALGRIMLEVKNNDIPSDKIALKLHTTALNLDKLGQAIVKCLQ